MLNGILASLARTKSATFAAFTYTAKGSGEVAKIRIILGASTENLYTRDVEALTALLASGTLDATATLAATELLNSRKESLEKGIGNNSAYTNADTYHTLPGVKGVRVHKETGDIYVTGLIESKEILTPGVHKVVNSSAKTIAKRKIEKDLPSGRFRLYKLVGVTTAALHGDVLTFGN